MARRSDAVRHKFATAGLSAGILGLSLAAALLSARGTAAPIVLTGGAATSTFGSQTLDYVSVSGTSTIDGTPSTYTAAGSGTLTIGVDGGGSSVTLFDFGVMTANIAVSAAGSADVTTDAVLSVNRAATFAGGVNVATGGTVQIGSLGSLNTAGGRISLSGAGALARSAGGHYSAGDLRLSSEAAATFVAGDTITGNVILGGTSSLVVQAPLSTSGYADLSDGGTLTVNAASSFANGVYAYAGGTLAIGTAGSVAAPGTMLYLSGPAALSRTPGGTYSADILSIADLATVDFVAGDTVTGDVYVDTGAILDLQTNLTTAGDVWVTNGGAIARSAQTISAGTLYVGGSAFQSIAGDGFDTVSVSGGGTFTNAAPLVLTSLSVSGDDGSGNASTATTGAALTIADGGSVNVNNGGRLDVASPLAVAAAGVADILVSGSGSVLHVASTASGFRTVSVLSGGSLDLAAGTLDASQLSLSGSTSFTRTTGSYGVDTLQLADSAAASYLSGDSISTSVVLLSGATLDLGKNLSLSGGLSLSDGAAITRTGATISASSLSISGLSSLALGTGDAIGVLSLSGGGRATSSTALVLEGSSTPLSIDDGSLLTLTMFDGLVVTPSSDVHYALQLYGDQRSLLESYLTAGKIVLGSAAQTPGVVYNPALYGNSTFIAYVVPEPSTMIFVTGSLAMLPLFRRRRRA